jgi:hypothetical protein
MRDGSLHSADDAPFEQQVPDLVVVLEMVGNLNTLKRGANNLPSLLPAGLLQARLKAALMAL